MCWPRSASTHEFFKDNVSDEDATLPSPDHKDPSLHVYVQSSRNRENVFSQSTRNPSDWSLSYEFRSFTEYKRGTILSNTLYYLTSEQNDFFFSAHNSVFSPSVKCLKLPPYLHVPFDICSMKKYSNNIYLHCDPRDEDFGRIYVYKTELGKWFSKKAPTERLMNTASVTTENGLLYLIGRESLQNAQVLDERTKEWSQLTNANIDVSKSFTDGACCVHQGKIFTAHTDVNGSVQMHVYEPNAGKWRQIPGLNRRKCFEDGLKLLSYTDNEIYMISKGMNFFIEVQ